MSFAIKNLSPSHFDQGHVTQDPVIRGISGSTLGINTQTFGDRSGPPLVVPAKKALPASFSMLNNDMLLMMMRDYFSFEEIISLSRLGKKNIVSELARQTLKGEAHGINSKTIIHKKFEYAVSNAVKLLQKELENSKNFKNEKEIKEKLSKKICTQLEKLIKIYPKDRSKIESICIGKVQYDQRDDKKNIDFGNGPSGMVLSRSFIQGYELNHDKEFFFNGSYFDIDLSRDIDSLGPITTKTYIDIFAQNAKNVIEVKFHLSDQLGTLAQFHIENTKEFSSNYLKNLTIDIASSENSHYAQEEIKIFLMNLSSSLEARIILPLWCKEDSTIQNNFKKNDDANKKFYIEYRNPEAETS